ncbi:MAG: glutathione S-transferase family protein [Betaproteobacteria bacterium]|nr:glutathione S-transferase family protein [Betaproteobacteria bacterium]
MPRLTLVSHALCPYVQRAAIVLAEKGAQFDRRTIDLANKPGWFLAVSPLGKTPVLLVGEEPDRTPVFESAVICEYLEDTIAPRLHPLDALERARHRSWMEFGSAILNTIAAFYNAPDDQALEARRLELAAKFTQVEAMLSRGPYFSGESFSVVDAVFGPVFRYFDTFDSIRDFTVFTATPKVRVWREALGQRPSVRNAVTQDYPEKLVLFLKGRNSALSGLISA